MTKPRHHDEFVGYRVYEAHRALFQNLERALAPFGVTPVEWNAMNQLDHHGPLSQKRLAEALQKEQATITRTVDRMQRKGLVTRTPDPKDRRANIVSLTPASQELLTEIEPHAISAAKSTIAEIDPADLAVFFRVLNQVRDNARKKDSE
ncbi:MarR family winged helix-turn-helix transcriptional regulator [Adlercreutzia sp. ZJ473]|uniref:MarR family winged helix-turn-helix transcriptional regulator n=1 Tax=Adlercreutzia sp. ZJ473 TaxID=2722822 RepID=UPI001551B0FD|nr:MarR family transcriptional regulator [Adlercreutzia sp. ZJ473]